MGIQHTIERLRALNETVPKPLRLPSQDEVDQAENELGVKFHNDFRQFLLEASDVVFGVLEPGTITRPSSHTHLPKLCADAWSEGVPKEFLPICEDNGDYYCMNPHGQVVFLSHNGWNSETWPDLATWIEDCDFRIRCGVRHLRGNWDRDWCPIAFSLRRGEWSCDLTKPRVAELNASPQEQ